MPVERRAFESVSRDRFGVAAPPPRGQCRDGVDAQDITAGKDGRRGHRNAVRIAHPALELRVPDILGAVDGARGLEGEHEGGAHHVAECRAHLRIGGRPELHAGHGSAGRRDPVGDHARADVDGCQAAAREDALGFAAHLAMQQVLAEPERPRQATRLIMHGGRKQPALEFIRVGGGRRREQRRIEDGAVDAGGGDQQPGHLAAFAHAGGAGARIAHR